MTKILTQKKPACPLKIADNQTNGFLIATGIYAGQAVVTDTAAPATPATTTQPATPMCCQLVACP